VYKNTTKGVHTNIHILYNTIWNKTIDNTYYMSYTVLCNQKKIQKLGK